MNVKKIIALLLALVLVGSMAACGTKPAGDKDGSDGMPQTEEEAKALHDRLWAEETSILSENTELWEKLFLAADKGMAMIEDGNNYGDFLLKTIERAKDKFTDEELAQLTERATKIKDIEDQLSALEEKFPSLASDSTDSSDNSTSVPSGDVPSGSITSGGTPSDANTSGGAPAESTGPKFPAFTGKDLDGNDVSSDKLFAANAVTVVNFWFTTCGPCVGELGDLDALNQELSAKGGSLIGINAFTLGGDKTAIADAKDVLSKSGATYRNVYFDPGSEAGKFTENVYAYPTTYVVDRNGNIVGDPIVGAITGKTQADALQTLIDKAIAADKG